MSEVQSLLDKGVQLKTAIRKLPNGKPIGTPLHSALISGVFEHKFKIFFFSSWNPHVCLLLFLICYRKSRKNNRNLRAVIEKWCWFGSWHRFRRKTIVIQTNLNTNKKMLTTFFNFFFPDFVQQDLVIIQLWYIQYKTRSKKFTMFNW